MENALNLVRDSGDLIPVIAIGGGLVIAFFWILLATISETIKNVARERTRREIAAYIAEGTMTPEQGERLLKVNLNPDSDD